MLHTKYWGPFELLEQINNVTLPLNLRDPMKAKGIHDTFYCCLIKPYVPDKFNRYDKPLLPIKIQDEFKEYEVERILDSKTIRGHPHFLVK